MESEGYHVSGISWQGIQITVWWSSTVVRGAAFRVPDQNQWLGSCLVEGEGGSNAVIFMCAELSVHHVLVLVEFSLLAMAYKVYPRWAEKLSAVG